MARRWCLWMVVLASAGWAAAACAPRGPESREAFDTETRATMAGIADALRTLLPLAASEERFAAPENRVLVEGALQRLAGSAEALDRHGESGDAAFAALAEGLKQDAAEGLERFERGRPEEARFLVRELTHDCVGCHARLAGPSSPGLGASLVEGLDPHSVTPAEWAEILVATRQFERALDAYEALFAADEGSLRRVDLEPLLVDYLIVAVRVERDLPRAEATLSRVVERRDLPVYLARHVRRWRDDLAALRQAPPPADPVARAAELAGSARSRPAVGRSDLIHDLVASGLLHAYVHDHPEPSPQAARAYYLLGVTELHIRRSLWVSPADAYLETAIRMEPDAEWAPDAYELLEAHTYWEFQGSSGHELPEDVEERLEELRGLVEG